MPDTPAPSAPSWRRRHWKLLTVLAVLVVCVAILFARVWIPLRYTYSEGYRAGYAQKISEKGWICKTWEGELAMANMPGTMPEIFKFTVHNDSIARLIEKNLGKRVSLTYEEHRGVPTSCFGETQYYITNMRLVEP